MALYQRASIWVKKNPCDRIAYHIAEPLYRRQILGIWNGEATIRNLTLRTDILDKLDLPLIVKFGFLGAIQSLGFYSVVSPPMY